MLLEIFGSNLNIIPLLSCVKKRNEFLKKKLSFGDVQVCTSKYCERWHQISVF